LEARRVTLDKRNHLYPCHGCGAGLEFAPGQLSLKCPYCGRVEEIPQCADDIRELAYLDYFKNVRIPPEVLAESMQEVKCHKCGAVSEFPASVAADRCPFCSTHLENPPKSPEKVMRPQGVLPFIIQNKEARERFQQWVGSRWFAPNNLKKLAQLGRIDGLYVPYWTYDSLTISFYTGMRGEYYWETVRTSKGTKMVRKTRWYPASGTVRHWFDDVLVCASKGLPPKYVRQLEPWELQKAQSFSPQLIAGFKVERYQRDAEQGFDEAKTIMDEEIRVLVRRAIGGDTQQITSIRTQYDGITFKHLLLPVWLSAFDYHGKTYRVLINAQTGQVRGERPYSWIKITLAVIGALILAGLIVALVGVLEG
jgi:DNA-directed RNA polymerase subunit RPC12/RpoP